MPVILLASNNHGKLHEIQTLFNRLPDEDEHLRWLSQVKLMLPQQIPLDLEVREDGLTYAENAGLKAAAFYRACRERGCLSGAYVVLADDSGLEVDVLRGAPGVFSARYAPAGVEIPSGRAGDALRRHYLLQQLQPYPQPWTARFHCTIALACADRPIAFVHGVCPGIIQAQERGSGGFGYDPIFFIPHLEKTMAELSTEEKNRISHRARAVRAAIPVLYQIFHSFGDFD